MATWYRNTTAHAMAGSLLACAATVSAASDRADQATSVASAASADLIGLSLEQLLDVQVVGASKYAQKQSQVAAAVNVLTRDEIRGFGWRTLAEALASLPGVHTTYDRQYSFFGARGFGLPGDFNTRVLVMVNGNRVNDVTYDQAPIGRDFPLDLDLVERIEFIPGPGGAVYGQNAMFGVVNVVTRQGDSFDGARLAVGWQGAQRSGEARATWGRKLDNGVDLLLSASRLKARGEDRFVDFGSTGISGVARGQDGERDREFFARAGRDNWSLEFVDGDHRKDNPVASYLADPLVPGQYQGDRYTLAQWQYADKLGQDSLQLHARLFAGRAEYNARVSYTDMRALHSISAWRGAEMRLLFTGLAGHKLMFGAEYQDNPSIRQDVVNTRVPDIDPVHIDGKGYRAGLFGQHEWQISPSLSSTLGLRVDRNNSTGTRASPRAALIWQASAWTTLKLLYGTAQRAPNAYERDYHEKNSQVANLALKGESIVTQELVVDHRAGPDLSLRAALYRWTMRDLITLGMEPVSGLSQYQSGDEVQALGIALSADKAWPKGTRLRASLALQDIHRANGQQQLNAPKQLLKLNLLAPLPGNTLLLAYEWQFDSARRSLDGSSTGGYALSNLRLSGRPSISSLTLGLSVRNLLAKRYAQPAPATNWQNSLSQDGRSLRIDAQYAF